MHSPELIDQLILRDESAVSTLVNSYEEYVGSICFGFVRSQFDAEEITQDVFVKAIKEINKFRRDSELSTWLYRIAVNQSLQFLRAQNRKKRSAQLLSLFSLQEKGDDIADKGPLQDEVLIHAEENKEIRRALNTLPERQRTAFVLRYSNDHTYDQIAEIMDTTVKTVSALLQRAKEKLKCVL